MIVKPPHNISKRDITIPSVFLAGSIEMGKAENWQDDLSEFFTMKGWNVFNPRREDWDSSWEQKFENPQFYQQVNWELDALDKAEMIVMYLDPNTKSPISLLELGLYANSKKITVICPEDFWRSGNVEIVCNKFNIQLFSTIADFKRYSFV